METQLFIAVLFSCFPALVSSTQTQVTNSTPFMKKYPDGNFVDQINIDFLHLPCFQAYSSACSNGHPGIPGSPGLPGPYGRDGAKGEKGERGTKGGKGEVGAQTPSNWKQCVWNKGDDRDHGLLQVGKCSSSSRFWAPFFFYKIYSTSTTLLPFSNRGL